MMNIRSNRFNKMMDTKEMSENYKLVRKDGKKLYTGRKLKTMASVRAEIKDLIKIGDIKSSNDVEILKK